MTNTHLYFAIGLPIVAVLTSLVISLVQIFDIRSDLREIRTDIKLLTGKVYEMMGQRS
jgi:hypothetical protein